MNQKSEQRHIWAFVKKIILDMAMKRNMHEVEEMRERKKQKNRESAQRARDRFKAK